MSNKFKIIPLDELIDKQFGTLGTKEREAFENELRIDFLGYAIRQARLERNLTMEQLGEIVGVQKSQISKIESNLQNAKFGIILKVLDALGINVNVRLELNDKELFADYLTTHKS